MKLFLLAVMMFFGTPAMAQLYVQGGAYFGQNGCGPGGGSGGGLKIPREVRRIERDQKQVARDITKGERLLRDEERKKEKSSREYDRAIETIEAYFRDDNQYQLAKGIIHHVQTGEAPSVEKIEKNEQAAPWGEFVKIVAVDIDNSQPTEAGKRYKGVSGKWLHGLANPRKPNADMLCGEKSFQRSHAEKQAAVGSATPSEAAKVDPTTVSKKTAEFVGKSSSYSSGSGSTVTPSESDCKKAVATLGKLYQEKVQAENSVAALERKLEELENFDEQLTDDKQYEVESWNDDLVSGRATAAGICYSCIYGEQREVSTTDKVLGLVGSLANAGVAVWGTKKIIDSNAQMGWPTSPWVTYSMAAPMVMAGIYGAAGGGMGSFGCGAGMAGGLGGGAGAFGYPAGLYGGLGGGLYGPGMAMSGYYAGFPGYYAGGIGGAIGGGIVGAYGIPYAGMPYAGMPYMGMPYAGAIAGGIGGAIVGMPYMGMPYAGGMPYMGMPYGGGMPYMGMPYAGGAPMGGSNAAMQYQMQMMQMYQQQMNSWLQEQQRMQQDYANRTQMVGRLQEELVRIQAQITQISYGGYSGGYGSSYGGSGGSTLVPTGTIYDPVTGQPMNGDPNLGGPARGRGY